MLSFKYYELYWLLPLLLCDTAYGKVGGLGSHRSVLVSLFLMRKMSLLKAANLQDHNVYALHYILSFWIGYLCQIFACFH